MVRETESIFYLFFNYILVVVAVVVVVVVAVIPLDIYDTHTQLFSLTFQLRNVQQQRCRHVDDDNV